MLYYQGFVEMLARVFGAEKLIIEYFFSRELLD